MKKIIDPVDRALLKAELTPECLLRKTNRAGNELYVVTNQNAPNVVREIGRLREIAFRDGGGGTGEPLDIDKFDTDPAYGYRQLVLWDPEVEEIIGGYRFVLCDEAVFDRYGQPHLTSSHMFEFSKKFLEDYIDVRMKGTNANGDSLYIGEVSSMNYSAATTLSMLHDAWKYETILKR